MTNSVSLTVNTTAVNLMTALSWTHDNASLKSTITFQAGRNNTGYVAAGFKNTVNAASNGVGVQMAATESYTVRGVRPLDVYLVGSAAGQHVVANVHSEG